MWHGSEENWEEKFWSVFACLFALFVGIRIFFIILFSTFIFFSIVSLPKIHVPTKDLLYKLSSCPTFGVHQRFGLFVFFHFCYKFSKFLKGVSIREIKIKEMKMVFFLQLCPLPSQSQLTKLATA